MSAPTIVVAHSRERKALSPVLRGVMIERYRRTCQYCGGTSPTWEVGPDGKPWNVDHKIPVLAGGSDDESNLTLSCATCNQRKGSDVPKDAGIELVYLVRPQPWRTGAGPESAEPLRVLIVDTVARLRAETGEWPAQVAVCAAVNLCRRTFQWNVSRLVQAGRLERLHGGRALRIPPHVGDPKE